MELLYQKSDNVARLVIKQTPRIDVVHMCQAQGGAGGAIVIELDKNFQTLGILFNVASRNLPPEVLDTAKSVKTIYG